MSQCARVRPGDVSKAFFHLTTTIGPRPATSLEEALAAAYIDGRFRHAGMQVSIDPFVTASVPPLTVPLLTLVCVVASVLVQWFPLFSLLLALWTFIAALIELAGFPLPGPMIRPRSSQNVVATRAAQSRTPTWRVVLLAALDTPRRAGAWWSEGTVRQTIPIRIAFASAAVLMLGLLGAWVGFDRVLSWPGQGDRHVNLAMLVVILQAVIVGWLLLTLRPSPLHCDPVIGASGALAVLQRVPEHLPALQWVELWGVGVGATTVGPAGVDDLLARYPFPRTETMFLTLECIAGGVPVCVSHEGTLHRWRADPVLLDLAEQLRATNTDAHPFIIHPHPDPTTLTFPLHRRGFRVLAIRADGPSTTHVSTRAALQVTMEQTAQLVAELIRHLDRIERHGGQTV